jgi:preprotein translocase subunit SecG
MDLTNILNILQIVISILLVSAILLQQRGTGLGGAFGGGGNVYRSKRGVEQVLFNATIVLAILFVAAAIANFILQ